MADEIKPGLSFDASKIPTYGTSDEDLKAIQEALNKNIQSVEQRYAQPNWFKVAAGFAKPQLGGFFASLGSANEALGDWQEKQRDVQIPLAQMRSQLAQTNLLMKKNVDVSREVEEWKKAHPGQTPSASQVSEWTSKYPDSPVAKALQQESDRILQRIRSKQEAGFPLDPTESEYLRGGMKQGEKPAVAPVAPSTPSAAPDTSGTKKGKPADESIFTGKEIKVDFSGLDEASKKSIIKDFAANNYFPDPNRDNVFVKKEEGKKAGSGEYYPMSTRAPEVAGLDPYTREITMEAFKKNSSDLEEPYKVKMQSLSDVVTGPEATRTRNVYETAIKLIESNPERAERVFSLVRNSGPLLAALNQGIGVHAGNFTANVNLPVDAFLQAKLTKEDKQFADRIYGLLISIGNANMKSQGIKMQAGTQQEYMSALRSAAHLEEMASSALNKLHHDLTNFDYNKEYFDTMRRERTSRVHPSSPTPFYDVATNSPELAKLEKKYAAIHSRWDEQFQRSLGN